MASVDRTAQGGHSAAGSSSSRRTGVIGTTLKAYLPSLLLFKVTWSVLLTFTACCVLLMVTRLNNTTVRRHLYTSFLPSRNSSDVVSITMDSHRHLSFASSNTNDKPWPADVYVTGLFKTFVRAHNFSSVVEYLLAVNTYLLTFRSPHIRENPFVYSWPETEGDKKRRELLSSKTKLVVWYNPTSTAHRRIGRYQFDHCPVKECNMSLDFERDHAKADAVVLVPRPGAAALPRDHADQVYVFYTMESPYYTYNGYGSTAWNTAFNWTWNFRVDSDIFQAVRWLKRSPALPPLNALLTLKRQKTKSAAWMVSRCGAHSQRDQYVRELRKILPVDIYGFCGDLFCRRGDKKCDLLLNDYLFYLSFENSMCVDYITEKFYRTFTEGVHVLPVVRGGANYSRYFPEGTFIDAEAFSGPEELGRYMLELAGDEARYVDMLWRRAHFVHDDYGYIDAHCQLCYKLHHVNRFQKTYPDMFGWYHKNGCTSPKRL